MRRKQHVLSCFCCVLCSISVPYLMRQSMQYFRTDTHVGFSELFISCKHELEKYRISTHTDANSVNICLKFRNKCSPKRRPPPHFTVDDALTSLQKVLSKNLYRNLIVRFGITLLGNNTPKALTHHVGQAAGISPDYKLQHKLSFQRAPDSQRFSCYDL